MELSLLGITLMLFSVAIALNTIGRHLKKISSLLAMIVDEMQSVTRSAK